MKKLKQIFAMMFTIIFMVGALLPAYANEKMGSIVINNTPSTTGATMKGHTYSAYKIFDVTIKEDGNSAKYAYNLDENFKEFFKVKAIERQVDITTDIKLNEFAKKYLNDSKDKMHEVSKELIKYIVDKEFKPNGDSKEVATNGKVEVVSIDDLPLGYYLVADNGTKDGSKPESAIALGAMDTLGNGLVLEITLKASAPTIDKEIKHNEDGSWGNVGDNQIGDTVEYRFISSVPDITGYNKYDYMIHDKMSDGLTFNNDIKIYIGEKNSEKNNLLDAKYYNVYVPSKDKDSFDVSIDIIEAIKDEKLKAGDKLYTYFSATLNEKAVVAGSSNNNTVDLEYSNNPYDEESKDKTPGVTVKDYTFKLNALKTGGTSDESNALSGAQFEIKKGDNAISFKETAKEDGTNVYTVCADKHDHTGENPGCTKTIVSGTNGKFEIVGLDDAITYTIVETKAPDGYNPIDPIDFTIVAEYDEEGNITSINTNVDNISKVGDSFELGITIINTTDTLLPETGGIGTTIFTIVGSGLMIFAAIVLIRKRHIG